MPSASLRIAAIHNGELETAPAYRVIQGLLELSPTTVEFTEQRPLTTTPNTHELRAWRRRQGDLEASWATYLDRPKSSLTAAAGRWGFDARITLSGDARRMSWQVRQVEKAVTRKHAQAWRDFASSSDTELLILESDAGVTDSTVAVLKTLLEDPSGLPCYVNLAGGLDPKALGIDLLSAQSRQDNAPLTTYSKPVTNTSCAYLINQPMAHLVLEYLEREPLDEQLGIDWLWNAVFLANQEVPIECLHAQPPAIIHGSTQGLTKSWHPQR